MTSVVLDDETRETVKRFWSVDDVKNAIRLNIAEQIEARESLTKAQSHPEPVSEEMRAALGIENEFLSNVDLAKARLRVWVEAEEQLWLWYGVLTDGETSGSRKQGRQAVG